jgi:hypothetical protein
LGNFNFKKLNFNLLIVKFFYISYVLYIPNEFALHVYSQLWEKGQKYEIKHAGYYATRALRIEKLYAMWGQDLDTFTTPLECGECEIILLKKFEFKNLFKFLFLQVDHGE